MNDLAEKLRLLELERLELQASKRTGTHRKRDKRVRDKATASGSLEASRPRKPGTPRKSLFSSAPFIAIDGEGVTEGRVATFRPSRSKPPYKGAAHYMILLAASTGDEITAAEGRLSLAQCLDFLLGLTVQHPNSILVCYGGSYDVNQMLLYNLPRCENPGEKKSDFPSGLRAIAQGGKALFVHDGKAYRIEYRARKSLKVWRFSGPGIGFAYSDDGAVHEEKAEARFVLWDAIGFFQGAFTETLAAWLGKDWPDLAFIESMKGQRGGFTRAMLPEMREYNQAECRALVCVMDRFREAVDRLGLTLARWDGAGAIAGAMNSLHGVKAFKGKAPPEVFHAVRCAFSGGHIEMLKIGTFTNAVHHYDVNSAYPAIIRELPDLSDAVWQHGTDPDPPPGFTLVKVRYIFAQDRPFYPLFFRCDDGSILYPQYGCGWHWYSEFECARDFVLQEGATEFEVLEWWHAVPVSAVKPFAFVDEYYEQRRGMAARIKKGLGPDEQWMKGAEKIIKLGLNSLYGKTAQQLGGRNGEPPPYFQLEWAGYITAGCRAQLMRAAMQDPSAIISFATDGLFSLRPLVLDCPESKELGKWEYTQEGGMIAAMPGVYWLFDPGQQLKDKPARAFSRGFDKQSVETPALVLQAWQAGSAMCDIPSKRLVTMGSACSAETDQGAMWKARGRFLDGIRQLDISGGSAKRHPPDQRPRRDWRLWKEHAATLPRGNWRYLDWLVDFPGTESPDSESAPFALAWLEDPYGPEEAETLYLEEQEELDAEEMF